MLLKFFLQIVIFRRCPELITLKMGIQSTLGNWRWHTRETHITKCGHGKDARKTPDNAPHMLSPRRQLPMKWPHSCASPVAVCKLDFLQFCSGFCKYLSCIKCMYLNVGKLEVKIKFIRKFQYISMFSERTKSYDSYCS